MSNNDEQSQNNDNEENINQKSSSLANPNNIVQKKFDFELFNAKIKKSYKQIEISRKMRKFFKKRYQLFNKFDSGILMDAESWYSVTPECLAHHIAEKCFRKLNLNRGACVLDAFCGSGGNTIQFCKYFDKVISCDIDFVKLQCAQNNARVYNCLNGCNFLMQDFFQLHNTLNLNDANNGIDLIFLSPPWGGVNYVHNRKTDISAFPLDGFKIFLYCIKNLKCKNIVYFLPRNSNLEQVKYMAGVGGSVEIENNYIGDKFVAITCYYGDLANLI
jgi:tRNA/tmRNA/rRNA uracil-C5-methylase (TrmA/RlmC/RlmD family)